MSTTEGGQFAIRDAYNLYKDFYGNISQEFEKKQKAPSLSKFGKEEYVYQGAPQYKITDLFFVKTGEGFEFIKKNSFKGYLTRFLDSLRGKEQKSRFDLGSNLQAINNKFNEVLKQVEQTKDLDTVAKGIDKDLTADQLKEVLYALRTHLQSLSWKDWKAQATKKMSKEIHFRPIVLIDKEQIKKADSAAKKILSLQESIAASFETPEKKLTNEEKETVARIVSSSGLALDQIPKEKVKERLLDLLQKTLDTPIVQADREQAISVLNKFMIESVQTTLKKPESREITENSNPTELIKTIKLMTLENPIYLQAGSKDQLMLMQVTKEVNQYKIRIYNDQTPLADGYREYRVTTLDDSKGLLGLGLGSTKGLISHLTELKKKSGSEALEYFTTNIAPILKVPKDDNVFIESIFSPEREVLSPDETFAAAAASVLVKEDEKVQELYKKDMAIADKYINSMSNLLKLSREAKRQEYNEAKQFLTRFSKRAENYYASQKELVEAKVTQYSSLLKRLNAHIISNEMQKSSKPVEELTNEFRAHQISATQKTEVRPLLPTTGLKAKTALQAPSKEEIDTFKAIDTLKNKQSATAVLESIRALSKLNFHTHKTYWAAFDQFCKAVGSLEKWDSFTFEAPQELIIKQLHELIGSISQNIDAKKSPAEHFGVLFFLQNALETECRRESAACALEDPFISSLATHKTEVSRLLTSDPFWVEIFNEIGELDTGDPFAQAAFTQKEATITLSSAFAQQFLSGIEVPDSPVVKSIREHREQQKVEIDKKIEAEQKIIDTHNETIKKLKEDEQNNNEKIETTSSEIKELDKIIDNFENTLRSKVPLNKDDFDEAIKAESTFGKIKDMGVQIVKQIGASEKVARLKKYFQKNNKTFKEEEINKLLLVHNNNCREINSKKDYLIKLNTEKNKIENEIKKVESDIENSEKKIGKDGNTGTIARDVHADAKYWPLGIGPDDHPRWDAAQRAGFFLQKDTFASYQRNPSLFSLLQDSVTVQNIFKKTDTDIAYTLQFDPKDPALKISSEKGTFLPKAAEQLDLYEQSLPRESKYLDIYQHLYKSGKYPQELLIPRAAAVNLDIDAVQQDAANPPEEKKGVVAGIMARFLGEKTVEFDDELRALCQLHSSKEMQIDSTLSYFQENPKILSTNEGRILLQSLLFQSDLLANQLSDSNTAKTLVPRLSKFFKEAIQSGMQERDFIKATACCKMAACVQSYINKRRPNETTKVMEAKDIIAIAIRSAHPNYSDTWPQLFENLLGAASYLLDPPLQTEEDDKLFIHATLFRGFANTNPEAKNEDKVSTEEAKKASRLLDSILARFSEKSLEGLMNEHAKHLFAEVDRSFAESEFVRGGLPGTYESRDKHIAVSLYDGTVEFKTELLDIEAKKKISESSIDTLVKRQLYANPKECEKILESSYENVTVLRDNKKHVDIKIIGEKISIKPKELSNLCELREGKEKIATGDNTYLQSLPQAYDTEKNITYFLDPDTLSPLFETANTKIKVFGTEPGEKLFVSSTPKMFQSFEQKEKTVFLVNDAHKLQEVRFPDRKLTLKNLDGSWVLKSAPLWKLASEQCIPGYMETGRFLLFENKENINAKEAYFSARDGTGCFSCRIVNGRPEPTAAQLSARYQAAELSIDARNYEEAERLLVNRFADLTTEKLSLESRERLSAIAHTKPKTHQPQELRLRMKALSILVKNDRLHAPEAKKDAQERQKELDLIKESLPFAEGSEIGLLKELVGAADGELQEKIQDKLKDLNIEYTPPPRFAGPQKPALEDLPQIGPNITPLLADEYFAVTREQKALPDNLHKIFPKEKGAISKKDDVPKEAEGKFEKVANDVEVAPKLEFIRKVEIREGQDIACLSEKLTTSLKEEKKRLAEFETSIVTYVATTLGTAAKYPSIDEICLLFCMQNSQEMIKKFYPALELHTNSLMTAVTQYLFQKQNVQQLERCLNEYETYQKISKTGNLAEKELSLDRLFMELTKTRNYTEEHRVFQKQNVQQLERCLSEYETYQKVSKTENLAEKELGLDRLFMELTKTLKYTEEHHLFQKQNVQQLERCLNEYETYQKVSKTGNLAEKELSLDRLFMELTKTLNYTEEYHLAPLLLFFETMLGVKLRRDQVQMISDLVAGIGTKKQARQMIMGSGKTEMVQPLLAILLANTGRLSTVFETESGFNDVARGLSEKFGRVFDKSVITMDYHGKYFKEPPYTFLDHFLSTLKEAKEMGQCVLSMSKIKHSIITSLTVAYDKYSKDPSPQNSLLVDKIAAICKFLAENEYVQMDEIHLIMDPKVVFKRAIGEESSLDLKRQEMVRDLMLHLVTSKEIYKQISIECIDKMHAAGKQVKKQGVAFSKPLYDKVVKPFLAKKALELLKNSSEGSGALKELIKDTGATFLTILTGPLTKESLAKMELLINNKTHLTQTDKELIDSLMRVILQVLPSSLSQAYNAKNGYGKDPTGKTSATPYDAPGISKTTNYANPHAKLIYSMQMYFCDGLPTDYAKELLRIWKKEAQENHLGNFERFKELMPVSANLFLSRTHQDFPKLVEQFRVIAGKDPEILKDFFKTTLSKDITYYSESAVSTPHTLDGSSKYTLGYSATPPDEEILGEGMKVKRELGTDGQTIIAVEEKVKVGVYSDLGENKPLSKQVLDMFKGDPDLFVFIDSGGWLKDENSEDFAFDLLKKSERKGIEGVYFYQDKKCMCVKLGERGQKLVVPAEASGLEKEPMKRLTILGQNEETGTNIKQHPTAKAFLSIRKDMTLDDLNQAVFRMREIRSGQGISFGISEEVKANIVAKLFDTLLGKNATFANLFKKDPPITPEDLASCKLTVSEKLKENINSSITEYNRLEKKQLISEDLRKTAFLKIFEKACTIDSERVWNYVTINASSSMDEKKGYSKQYKERESKELPMRKIMIDTEKPIAERLKAFESVRGLIIEKESDKFIWSSDLAAGGEVEIEQQFQVEKEEEHFEEDEVIEQAEPPSIGTTIKIPVPDVKKFEQIFSKGATGYNIDEFFTDAEKLPKLETIVPKDLGLPDTYFFKFSPNLIPEMHPLDSKESLNHYLDARYILSLTEGSTPSYILVSSDDAKELKEGLLQGTLSQNKRAGLFTFDGQLVAGKNISEDVPFEIGKDILAQAKLALGKPFKTAEAEALAKLEGYKDNQKKWRSYYEKRINLLPNVRDEYLGGPLDKKFETTIGTPSGLWTQEEKKKEVMGLL